jgi:hypothetical protein
MKDVNTRQCHSYKIIYVSNLMMAKWAETCRVVKNVYTISTTVHS